MTMVFQGTMQHTDGKWYWAEYSRFDKSDIYLWEGPYETQEEGWSWELERKWQKDKKMWREGGVFRWEEVETFEEWVKAQRSHFIEELEREWRRPFSCKSHKHPSITCLNRQAEWEYKLQLHEERIGRRKPYVFDINNNDLLDDNEPSPYYSDEERRWEGEHTKYFWSHPTNKVLQEKHYQYSDEDKKKMRLREEQKKANREGWQIKVQLENMNKPMRDPIVNLNPPVGGGFLFGPLVTDRMPERVEAWKNNPKYHAKKGSGRGFRSYGYGKD